MTTLTALPSQEITPVSARRRYLENIYYQDGVVLIAVLTSLLYLILATSLDAAGYVDNISILVPVTLGALVLGFLMAFSRFDGFFALSHSMFTGLAWILFLMSGQVSKQEIAPFISNGIPAVQATAYFVLLRWLNWIDAAINNIASNDNYIFIFEMCFLLWWLTYLGVWSIMRYGYTWRAIVPAGVVLLVNTYYAPESILGFLVVFCLIAMLLFVRTNLAEQQLRWNEQRIHYSPDVTFDFLRNGLAYSVVIVAVAWIVPGLGRSMEVRTVLDPVNKQWEQVSQRMNQLYQGIKRQTSPTSSNFGQDLTLHGARNVSDKEVFRVKAAHGRYWRAVVYDNFDGKSWHTTTEETTSFDQNQTVGIANWQLRQPLTQTITLVAPSGGMIFAAPDIVSVNLPISAGVRKVPAQGAGGKDAVEITSAQSQRELQANDSYVVLSSETAVTERALKTDNTNYPDAIRAAYLQLPDNFSKRVAADAKSLTANQATVYDKARAIETYLRSFKYNDSIAAPPPNRDPIEYFLYDIKQGYCDYYATSMVMMLRSLGVPARAVSGYAEGHYNEETGLYSITERDAHTWVEVFFPTYGWIEFEPTAGESQLNRPTGNDAKAGASNLDSIPTPSTANPNNPAPNEPKPQDPNAPTPDNQSFSLDNAVSARYWWVWALLTPLVLVGGLWFIRRSRYSGPSGFEPELPSIFYERMQRWADRLGLSGLVSHTPYEQGQFLSRALPEGRAPITNITENYVRYRFSRRPLPVEIHHSTVPPAPVTEMISESDNGTLTQDWQLLQPLLWRKWVAKLAGMGSKEKGNRFALLKGKPAKETEIIPPPE